MADPNLNVNITGKDYLTAELKRVESSVIRFVGSISAAISAISVIGFPIVESVRFQTALLDAARTTQYNAEQIGVLKSALRELSTQINVSAPDLAKIATLGGQTGIGASDPTALVAFTKTVASAVSSMGLPAEEVVGSFSKLINIFNIPASQFQNAISALTAVGNASAVSAEQLFDVTRRVGDLGGSANFPQAIALAAAMVDLGMSAEVAGTSLTKIFSDFKSKAPEFASLMKKTGVNSTKEWIELVQTDGLGALNAYTDLLNTLSVEDASKLKANLTGQGRLFEAISKLQNQRQREVSLTKLAADTEKQALAIKERIVAANGESALAGNSEYQSILLRVEALKEAATQSSVVARLSAVSADAYKAGDAAAKAQAIILSGVAAQWQLFTNTVSKVLGSLGDVALPPLTDLLASMRAELNDPINADGVRKASEEILGALQLIGKAIGSLRSSISGGAGFNWGAVLHLAALAVGLAAIKGLGVLMASLGGAAATSFPALGRLNALLFGTTEASRKAAAALAETKAQTARVGGVLNVTGDSSALAKSVVETQRLTDMKSRLVGVTTNWNMALLSSQAKLASLYASAFPKLQSIDALENKILETTVKLDAARALGNSTGNRSAAQYESQLKKLTAQLVAVETAQNAAARSSAALARLNSLSTRIDNRVAEIDPFAGVSSLVPKLQALGTGAASSFNTAFARAMRLGPILTASFVAGAAQGRNAVERFSLGVISATTTAANALSATMLRMTVSIGGFVGQSVLSLTGYTAAWEAASSRTVRAALAAEISVSLLTKAIRGLMSLALKLVSFVFLAEMFRDVLKMIGVWDSLSTVISAVLDKMGIPIPGFLKSEADARELARATAEVEQRLAGAREEAAKMNPQMRALLTTSKELALATADLTFDPTKPTEAQNNLDKSFDAILVGYAAQAVAEGNLQLIQKERVNLNKELANLTTRQTTSFPGIRQLDSALGITDKAIATVRASLQKLDQDEATILSGSKAYDSLSLALQNVATIGIDATTAEQLFTRSTETGTSKLEEYANALNALLAAKDRAAVDKSITPDSGLSAASAGATAGDAAYNRRKLAIEANTVAEVALAKAVVDTREAMGAIAGPGTVLAGLLDRMAKSTSKEAIAAVTTELIRMKAAATQFQGRVAPSVAVTDLLDAKAQQAATKSRADMYTQWAKMARSAADATVNVSTESLKTIAAYAKATEDALIKADQVATEMKRRAANNADDKVTDAKTSERIAVIRQEFSEKERTLRQEQDLRKQYEGETAYTRARDAKQLRDLAAEEKRVTDAVAEGSEVLKARRSVDDRLANSNKLVSDTLKYGEAVKAANKELETPNLSGEQQIAIISKAKDSYDKMVASGKLAKDQLEAIIATPPVGSTVLVSDAEIAKAKAALSTLGTALQTGTSDLNAKLNTTYESAAQKFSAKAEESSRQLKELDTRYKVLLERLGTEGPAAVALIDAMFRSTGELSRMVEKVKKDTEKGLIDPSAMPALDPTAYLAGWTTQMKSLPAIALEAVRGGVSVPVVAETTQFVQGIEATKPTVIISPQFPASTAFDLTRTLAAMKLSVDIEGKVTVKKASGGFIGSRSIGANAAGGAISGPGTGTSDSILSWLSNGEYVMDALTTSAFGPNFFKGLQNAARGGFSGSFLRKLTLPTFATGGPVSLSLPTAILPSSGSSSVSPASRSSVDINLNVGGSRISLFGERQQADKLVQALKRMEVSA